MRLCVWLNLPYKLSEMLCQMMGALSDPGRGGWRQRTLKHNRLPWCWKVCSWKVLSTWWEGNLIKHQLRSCRQQRKFYFSLRKCKLNAKNIIDKIIPTIASDVTVKNASLEIVAKRSLKMRLEMGTTLLCHLIVMQFGQVKSKSSVSG